jgi:Protein of unknown function (DUF3999)
VSTRTDAGFAEAQALCLLAIFLLVAFIASAAGPLPSAWQHWRYSRAIEITPTGREQLVSVVVPLEVFIHDKGALNDLRVIDDQGTETPYVILKRDGTSRTSSLPSTLRENSFTPDQFTQLVIDLGVHTPFHNAVRIDTSTSDFIEWVQVDASDNGHLWRVVQERAPIFRFRKENHPGVQTVTYSENNAQYLRVRILNRDQKFPVLYAQVQHEVKEPRERIPAAIEISPQTVPGADRSVWSADLGAAGALITEVRFDVTAPAEFIRSVNLSSSPDGKDWVNFDAGEIYRYRRGDSQQEQLSISFPNGVPGARYIRVEILNGNDVPLATGVPSFYSTPRHVVFEQQPGRSYLLIYGQERAQAPQYDLGKRVDAKQMTAAAQGHLGPEEVNTKWIDPRPWTETHDIFLWLVLVVAVLLIAYAAWWSLRGSAAVPEP